MHHPHDLVFGAAASISHSNNDIWYMTEPSTADTPPISLGESASSTTWPRCRAA